MKTFFKILGIALAFILGVGVLAVIVTAAKGGFSPKLIEITSLDWENKQNQIVVDDFKLNLIYTPDDATLKEVQIKIKKGGSALESINGYSVSNSSGIKVTAGVPFEVKLKKDAEGNNIGGIVELESSTDRILNKTNFTFYVDIILPNNGLQIVSEKEETNAGGEPFKVYVHTNPKTAIHPFLIKDNAHATLPLINSFKNVELKSLNSKVLTLKNEGPQELYYCPNSAKVNDEGIKLYTCKPYYKESELKLNEDGVLVCPECDIKLNKRKTYMYTVVPGIDDGAKAVRLTAKMFRTYMMQSEFEPFKVLEEKYEKQEEFEKIENLHKLLANFRDYLVKYSKFIENDEREVVFNDGSKIANGKEFVENIPTDITTIQLQNFLKAAFVYIYVDVDKDIIIGENEVTSFEIFNKSKNIEIPVIGDKDSKEFTMQELRESFEMKFILKNQEPMNDASATEYFKAVKAAIYEVNGPIVDYESPKEYIECKRVVSTTNDNKFVFSVKKPNLKDKSFRIKFYVELADGKKLETVGGIPLLLDYNEITSFDFRPSSIVVKDDEKLNINLSLKESHNIVELNGNINVKNDQNDFIVGLKNNKKPATYSTVKYFITSDSISLDEPKIKVKKQKVVQPETPVEPQNPENGEVSANKYLVDETPAENNDIVYLDSIIGGAPCAGYELPQFKDNGLDSYKTIIEALNVGNGEPCKLFAVVLQTDENGEPVKNAEGKYIYVRRTGNDVLINVKYEIENLYYYTLKPAITAEDKPVYSLINTGTKVEGPDSIQNQMFYLKIIVGSKDNYPVYATNLKLNSEGVPIIPEQTEDTEFYSNINYLKNYSYAFKNEFSEQATSPGSFAIYNNDNGKPDIDFVEIRSEKNSSKTYKYLDNIENLEFPINTESFDGLPYPALKINLNAKKMNRTNSLLKYVNNKGIEKATVTIQVNNAEFKKDDMGIVYPTVKIYKNKEVNVETFDESLLVAPESLVNTIKLTAFIVNGKIQWQQGSDVLDFNGNNNINIDLVLSKQDKDTKTDVSQLDSAYLNKTNSIIDNIKSNEEFMKVSWYVLNNNIPQQSNEFVEFDSDNNLIIKKGSKAGEVVTILYKIVLYNNVSGGENFVLNGGFKIELKQEEINKTFKNEDGTINNIETPETIYGGTSIVLHDSTKGDNRLNFVLGSKPVTNSIILQINGSENLFFKNKKGKLVKTLDVYKDLILESETTPDVVNSLAEGDNSSAPEFQILLYATSLHQEVKSTISIKTPFGDEIDRYYLTVKPNINVNINKNFKVTNTAREFVLYDKNGKIEDNLINIKQINGVEEYKIPVIEINSDQYSKIVYYADDVILNEINKDNITSLTKMVLVCEDSTKIQRARLLFKYYNENSLDSSNPFENISSLLDVEIPANIEFTLNSSEVKTILAGNAFNLYSNFTIKNYDVSATAKTIEQLKDNIHFNVEFEKDILATKADSVKELLNIASEEINNYIITNLFNKNKGVVQTKNIIENLGQVNITVSFIGNSGVKESEIVSFKYNVSGNKSVVYTDGIGSTKETAKGINVNSVNTNLKTIQIGGVAFNLNELISVKSKDGSYNYLEKDKNISFELCKNGFMGYEPVISNTNRDSVYLQVEEGDIRNVVLHINYAPYYAIENYAIKVKYKGNYLEEATYYFNVINNIASISNYPYLNYLSENEGVDYEYAKTNSVISFSNNIYSANPRALYNVQEFGSAKYKFEMQENLPYIVNINNAEDKYKLVGPLFNDNMNNGVLYNRIIGVYFNETQLDKSAREKLNIIATEQAIDNIYNVDLLKFNNLKAEIGSPILIDGGIINFKNVYSANYNIIIKFMTFNGSVLNYNVQLNTKSEEDEIKLYNDKNSKIENSFDNPLEMYSDKGIGQFVLRNENYAYSYIKVNNLNQNNNKNLVVKYFGVESKYNLGASDVPGILGNASGNIKFIKNDYIYMGILPYLVSNKSLIITLKVGEITYNSESEFKDYYIKVIPDVNVQKFVSTGSAPENRKLYAPAKYKVVANDVNDVPLVEVVKRSNSSGKLNDFEIVGVEPSKTSSEFASYSKVNSSEKVNHILTLKPIFGQRKVELKIKVKVQNQIFEFNNIEYAVMSGIVKADSEVAIKEFYGGDILNCNLIAQDNLYKSDINKIGFLESDQAEYIMANYSISQTATIKYGSGNEIEGNSITLPIVNKPLNAKINLQVKLTELNAESLKEFNVLTYPIDIVILPKVVNETSIITYSGNNKFDVYDGTKVEIDATTESSSGNVIFEQLSSKLTLAYKNNGTMYVNLNGMVGEDLGELPKIKPFNTSKGYISHKDNYLQFILGYSAIDSLVVKVPVRIDLKIAAAERNIVFLDENSSSVDIEKFNNSYFNANTMYITFVINSNIKSVEIKENGILDTNNVYELNVDHDKEDGLDIYSDSIDLDEGLTIIKNNSTDEGSSLISIDDYKLMNFDVDVHKNNLQGEKVDNFTLVIDRVEVKTTPEVTTETTPETPSETIIIEYKLKLVFFNIDSPNEDQRYYVRFAYDNGLEKPNNITYSQKGFLVNVKPFGKIVSESSIEVAGSSVPEQNKYLFNLNGVIEYVVTEGPISKNLTQHKNMFVVNVNGENKYYLDYVDGSNLNLIIDKSEFEFNNNGEPTAMDSLSITIKLLTANGKLIEQGAVNLQKPVA